MSVRIDRCRERADANACTVVGSGGDSGCHPYRAGPRSITAPGPCVRVTGVIDYRSGVADRSVIGPCG